MKKKEYNENRNLKVEIKGMRFGAENGVEKKGVRANFVMQNREGKEESGEDNDDEVKERTIEEKNKQREKKKVRGKSVKNQYYQIWRGEKKREIKREDKRVKTILESRIKIRTGKWKEGTKRKKKIPRRRGSDKNKGTEWGNLKRK